MAANRQINYIKPSEPSFLAKFKKDAGYVEGPTVDTKKEAPSLDDLDDGPDDEDEKPVVVVLKKGDLTEDEAAQAQKEMKDKGKGEPSTAGDDYDAGDGRIVFRKPTKRSQGDASSDLNVSSSKKKKDKEKKQKSSSSKRVQNSSLLSFGDDEEEGDT